MTEPTSPSRYQPHPPWQDPATTVPGGEPTHYPAYHRKARPTKPARRRWVIPLVALIALATVGAGMFLVLMSVSGRPDIGQVFGPRKTALRVAYESCGNAGDLADRDTTLYLDLGGSDAGSGTLDVGDLVCVLGALNAPVYVLRQVEGTRAIDGRQSESWGSFEASWTYHPDDGLDMLIRER